MISSTSSSAFSTSIILMATASPVRLSTLCHVVSLVLGKIWGGNVAPTLCRPFQSCLHLLTSSPSVCVPCIHTQDGALASWGQQTNAKLLGVQQLRVLPVICVRHPIRSCLVGLLVGTGAVNSVGASGRDRPSSVVVCPVSSGLVLCGACFRQARGSFGASARGPGRQRGKEAVEFDRGRFSGSSNALRPVGPGLV